MKQSIIISLLLLTKYNSLGTNIRETKRYSLSLSATVIQVKVLFLLSVQSIHILNCSQTYLVEDRLQGEVRWQAGKGETHLRLGVPRGQPGPLAFLTCNRVVISTAKDDC